MGKTNASIADNADGWKTSRTSVGIIILGVIAVIISVFVHMNGYGTLATIGIGGFGIILTIDGISNIKSPDKGESRIDVGRFEGNPEMKETALGLNRILDDWDEYAADAGMKANGTFRAYSALILKLSKTAESPEFVTQGYEDDRSLMKRLTKKYLPDTLKAIRRNIGYLAMTGKGREMAQANLDEYESQMLILSETADKMSEHIVSGASMNAITASEYLKQKLGNTDALLEI